MTTSLCGQRHYRYTESLCTEPAGHYVRDRDPHAGPLIINGRERGGLAWDEPEEQPVTDRIPLDHLTSDALDALYERLEAAEETESQRQLATAREAFASATTRAARAEAELAALRRVARGYCPACGRGDAAPTTDDWEQQKTRADQAEELLQIAHETSNQSEAERARAVQRAEQLAATLHDVLRHFVHKGHPGEPCLSSGWISERTVARWRATLYPPQPAPAATPAGHDAGPSIAECAANDRAWPLQKEGQ